MHLGNPPGDGNDWNTPTDYLVRLKGTSSGPWPAATDALQRLLSGPTSHNLIATPGVKAASAGYCDIVTRKRKDGSIVRTAQAYEFYRDVRDIASELSRRLIRIFLRAEDGRRPVYGGQEVFQSDPHWRDYLQFHEYFHGDNGAGLGASHQTGWTALVAKLIQQSG
jgi:hypothetical protein